MKPLTCSLVLLLLASYACLGQTAVPEFGQFTETERNPTECSFDTEADAVVIFDLASANHDDQYRLITNRRVRFKILKEKGISRGDIEIRYYHADDFEYVLKVEALVCNFEADGNKNIQKLSGQQVYRQKINNYWSAVKFAMPNVKVGSIIEYRYESIKKNYGGLDDWYFQRDIPTMLSSFSLVVLPNYEFAYQVHRSNLLPIKIESKPGHG